MKLLRPQDAPPVRPACCPTCGLPPATSTWGVDPADGTTAVENVCPSGHAYGERRPAFALNLARAAKGKT